MYIYIYFLVLSDIPVLESKIPSHAIQIIQDLLVARPSTRTKHSASGSISEILSATQLGAELNTVTTVVQVDVPLKMGHSLEFSWIFHVHGGRYGKFVMNQWI